MRLPSYSKTRMFQWCAFSLLLYTLAVWGGRGVFFSGDGWPLLIQAALTKGANVNAGAFLGYWVDRTLYIGFDLGVRDKDPGISNMAKSIRLGARGLIVAACIIGVSVGTTA